MERFTRLINTVALLMIAVGLFTLSYVIYRQEEKGRWMPALHEPGATAVVDSYNGRVWHIEHEGKDVSILRIIDVPEREIKIFKGKK